MTEQVTGTWPIVGGEGVSPQLNEVRMGAIYGIVLDITPSAEPSPDNPSDS